LVNRARLLIDVVDAVTAAIGKDLVGVRLSPASALFGMADSDAQAVSTTSQAR
jgi:N-ethylmaleimide reductase